jgi:hypothetical protein
MFVVGSIIVICLSSTNFLNTQHVPIPNIYIIIGTCGNFILLPENFGHCSLAFPKTLDFLQGLIFACHTVVDEVHGRKVTRDKMRGIYLRQMFTFFLSQADQQSYWHTKTPST